MNKSKYIKLSALVFLVGSVGCTKLKESYTTSVPGNAVTTGLGDAGPGLLLSAAYNDIPAPFVNQDRVFSLQECTTDEALVPTRGGDWDDNGAWRVMHNHTWNADHDQILQTFNLLNKMNFDATNVLTLKPTKEQIAEAKFLRCLSLYYLLDFFNQFPLRQPGDNLLLPPPVYTGDSAINFIINDLTALIPDLDPKNDATKANIYAARMLLMRCYLNKGAFKNRKDPTFDPADLQKVIDLGQSIVDSNKYSYESNYFNNFSASNGSSKELIFGYPSSSGLTVNNPGVNARWMMTFHYNEYKGQAPNAGWNGFSTMGDFYSTFATQGQTVNFDRRDTGWDTRLGGRATSYPQTTQASGIRPGFLAGQQFDDSAHALKDRKGNPLAFVPTIADNMIEQGDNLEVTGIRVAKYVPDFSDAGGKYYSSNSGNWLALFRYPDVILMIAEAKLRLGTDAAGALTLVNDLRAARGAAPLAGPLVLNNPNNTKDPNTLLAERGRELYWEGVRRTDLIRFKVFLVPWQYKPADNDKYLLFPVPNQSLSVNPNLKQNTGY